MVSGPYYGVVFLGKSSEIVVDDRGVGTRAVSLVLNLEDQGLAGVLRQEIPGPAHDVVHEQAVIRRPSPEAVTGHQQALDQREAVIEPQPVILMMQAQVEITDARVHHAAIDNRFRIKIPVYVIVAVLSDGRVLAYRKNGVVPCPARTRIVCAGNRKVGEQNVVRQAAHPVGAFGAQGEILRLRICGCRHQRKHGRKCQRDHKHIQNDRVPSACRFSLSCFHCGSSFLSCVYFFALLL